MTGYVLCDENTRLRKGMRGSSFPYLIVQPHIATPCEAFTSDNDAMIEAGSEFPTGGHSVEMGKEINSRSGKWLTLPANTQ